VGKTAIFEIMTSYSGARIVLQGSASWRCKITSSLSLLVTPPKVGAPRVALPRSHGAERS
jgi:hypothetical protein